MWLVLGDAGQDVVEFVAGEGPLKRAGDGAVVLAVSHVKELRHVGAFGVWCGVVVAARVRRVKPATTWRSVGGRGRAGLTRQPLAADASVTVRRSRTAYEHGPTWIADASVIGGGFV